MKLSDMTDEQLEMIANLTESRIMTISKDDLRIMETQLMWSPQLEKEVVGYWKTLNGYWRERKIPACTCLNHDGGFMGKRSAKGKVYNPYFYDDEPCSMKWVEQTLKEGKWQMPAKEGKE